MKTDIVVFIVNALPGKNNYWIVLEAYVGFFSTNKKYLIEFCGTEANSSIPLLDSEVEQLTKMLVKDYGYGPYNLKNIKTFISDGKEYVITR